MEYTKFFSKKKFCKQKLSKNSIESYSHNAVFKKILNEKSNENIFMKNLDTCDYQNCIFTCDKSLLKKVMQFYFMLMIYLIFGIS
jgi:hypothetical protein